MASMAVVPRARPPLAPVTLQVQGPAERPLSARLARAQRRLLRRFIWQPPPHSICLRRCLYMAIRQASLDLGWSTVRDERDASVQWIDRWESGELSNLAAPRKISHVPGMNELGSKCGIGRALNRIRAEFPFDYDFHPVSFILPMERAKLKEYDAAYRAAARAHKKRALASGADPSGYLPTYPLRLGAPGPPPTPAASAAAAAIAAQYPALAPPQGCWPAPGTQAQPLPGVDRLGYIVKPDASSRGNGIYLALSMEDIEEAREGFTLEGGSAGDSDGGGDDSGSDAGGSGAGASAPRRPVMVQAYLPRPLLMDGRKFDLRIYVLVTSVYPTLRVFVYRQGLVRFATVKYEAPSEGNIAQRRMFLTNYAVNKPGERPRSPKPWDEPETEERAREFAQAEAEALAAAAAGVGGGGGSSSGGERRGGRAGAAPTPPVGAVACSGGSGGGGALAPLRTLYGDVSDSGGDDVDDGASVGSAGGGGAPSSRGAGVGRSIGGGGVGGAGGGAAAAPRGYSCSDDEDDSDSLGAPLGGAPGDENSAATASSPLERDGGPKVSSKMRGWEAPGDHHRVPLPSRDGKVGIVRHRSGCKWTISTLFSCLEEQGIDTEPLWERITDTIFKTLLSIRPSLAAKYRSARPVMKKEPPPDYVLREEAAAARAREAAKNAARRAAYVKSLGEMEVAKAARAEAREAAAAAAAAAAAVEEERARREAELASLASLAPAPASLEAQHSGSATPAWPTLSPAPNLRLSKEQYEADMMRVLMGLGVAGIGVSGPNSRFSSGRMGQQQAAAGGRGGGGAAHSPLPPVVGSGLLTGAGAGGASAGGAAAAGGIGSIGGGAGRAAARCLLLAKERGVEAATASAALGDFTSLSLTGSKMTLSAKTVPQPMVAAAAAAGRKTAAAAAAASAAARSLSRGSSISAGGGGSSSSAPEDDTVAAAGSSSSSSSRATPNLHATREGGASSTIALSSLQQKPPLAALAPIVSTAGTASSPSSLSPHPAPQAGKLTPTPMPTPTPTAPLTRAAVGTTSATATGTAAATPPSLSPASLGEREAAGASVAAAAACTVSEVLGLEEEDGEQGFRAFEFMGLDVILDMSHCVCGARPELCFSPQCVTAALPPPRLPPGLKRCQPKPVLLEINQSCSLHTDSDLDRIVKGDALKDGLTMAAPDERWLLESFVETIKGLGGLAGADAAAYSPSPASTSTCAGAGGGLRSGSGSSSGSSSGSTSASAAASAAASVAAARAPAAFTPDASLKLPPPFAAIPVPPPTTDPRLHMRYAMAKEHLRDPCKDPLLTRRSFTGTPLDERSSLNDLTCLHTAAVEYAAQSLGESAQLLRLWHKGYPLPATATAASAAAAAASTPPTPTPPGTAAATLRAPRPASGAMARPGATAAPSSSFSTATATATAQLAGSVPAPPEQAAQAQPRITSRESLERAVPWVPPPSLPLFTQLPSVWREEFWYGVRHHEILQACSSVGGGKGAAAAGAAAAALLASTPELLHSSSSAVGGGGGGESEGGSGSSGSGSGGGGGGGEGSGALAAGGGGGARGDEGGGASPYYVTSLATIPLLSPRAALVLLLRRIYEERHIGGFQRLSPPVHPALAARYRAISEHVPANLRETPAFARRRLEAARRRAGAAAAAATPTRGGGGR
jgi:hypothetical protein